MRHYIDVSGEGPKTHALGVSFNSFNASQGSITFVEIFWKLQPNKKQIRIVALTSSSKSELSEENATNSITKQVDRSGWVTSLDQRGAGQREHTDLLHVEHEELRLYSALLRFGRQIQTCWSHQSRIILRKAFPTRIHHTVIRNPKQSRAAINLQN